MAVAHLGSGDDWIRGNSGSKMSASKWGACTYMALPASGSDVGAISVFCKTESYSTAERLKCWMRPTRCGVEAFAYGALEKLCIPSPRMVAFGERRWLGFPLQTLIVTAEVERSETLKQFAENEWSSMELPQRRCVFNDIADTLAGQLRRAHAQQFIHHDLKWRNVLVTKTPSGYQTFWIDAPRAAYWRLRKRRGRIVDLSDFASLAVAMTSKYDRMRFMLRYLGPGRSPGEAARFCRAIDLRLERRKSRGK